VSTVGDLLALLHDADRLLRTFEGELRDWVRPPPSNVLVVDRKDMPGAGVRWSGAGPFPRASETRRRIWFEHPDRIRVEILRGGQLVRLGVRDRETWWRWARVRGSDTGIVAIVDGVQTAPPLLYPPLLAPASLLASLRFEPVGAGERVGREVVVARALPRAALPGSGELAFEFEFDSQHGTMLRRARFDKGRCVQVTEALAARFDGPIDPGRFEFEAPTGPREAEAPHDDDVHEP
jgi:hypothetical protein